jgi:hypothetical protein
LIFIPVCGLGGIRICDALGIDPVFGLLVLRVVNLSRRIDWRREILEKVATLLAVTID